MKRLLVGILFGGACMYWFAHTIDWSEMMTVFRQIRVHWVALAIILPGTVQMVVGNVIEPKLLGDSLELHPITVLLSLIFWGIIWGIPGMLLAAPITAVLKILLENIEITKPVATLLEGKLPKSPKELKEQPVNEVTQEVVQNVTELTNDTSNESNPS